MKQSLQRMRQSMHRDIKPVLKPSRCYRLRGFSLIELIICLMLVSILMGFAVPRYKAYLERKDLAEAKQQLLRISSELERFKARNYSYQGFDLADIYPSYDASNNQLLVPLGQPAETANYVISLVDFDSKQKLNSSASPSADVSSGNAPVIGLNWIMKAERSKNSNGEMKQPNNYDLLISSKGIRCMTKTANIVSGFGDCGTILSEPW